MRLLVESLDVKSQFYSDHWLNFADIRGLLPEDKPQMLAGIDRILTLPRDAFRSTITEPISSL
ncbi:hypothetical protein FACS1894205_7330 [Alphaproteobacteria bacterium]|nr:hypothetical protein FACS1894205_7330 [Alphaproteobacteria bacterium]